MHPKVELADRIEALLALDPGEFDPEVHVPMAQFLVDKLGHERDSIMRTMRSCEISVGGSSMGGEYDAAGNFRVRHYDRFAFIPTYGFFQKIDIAHWKQDSFEPEHASERGDGLMICYRRMQVRRVVKYFEAIRHLSLPPISLTRYVPQFRWDVQVP